MLLQQAKTDIGGSARIKGEKDLIRYKNTMDYIILLSLTDYTKFVIHKDFMTKMFGALSSGNIFFFWHCM